MVFKTPKGLDELVFYWWKIIDQPSINRDELENYIAFELFTFPLKDTKQWIQKAIDSKFLLFDESTEQVKLNQDLEAKFNAWQAQGDEKWQLMDQLLKKKWRPPITFTDVDRYNILLSDLSDSTIKAHADSMLASWVKFDHTDFDRLIKGLAKDVTEEGTEAQFSFLIDVEHHQIQHNCPEFLRFHAKNKILCKHLYRAITKLYTQDAGQTLRLLDKIVHEKDNWVFKSL